MRSCILSSIGTYESGAEANNIQLNAEYISIFWGQVQRGDVEDCWEWNGHLASNGYGVLSCGTPPFRVRYVVHRISYFLHYGVDPGDYLVCHKCDNRRCVNPNHLFLGTIGDNHRDAVAKGRKKSPMKDRFLSEHSTSLFTTDDPYWEMWALIKEDYAKKYVADLYGVSVQMLNNAIKSIEKRLSLIKKEN